MFNTMHYANGTSVTTETPFSTYRSARALCSDGKVRTVSRISETADTFFSVPAAVKVKGKTVSGYITTETVQGYSTEANSDPIVVKFVAHLYGKNYTYLPNAHYRWGRWGF